MLLREVEYARPSTVDEAVALLAAHDGARALAGGQTLVNVMKARAAAPDVLVDLRDLGELRTISFSARRVGARARGDGHLLRDRRLVRSRGGAARCSPRWRGRSPTSRCETAARSAATSASTIRRTTSRRCSSRSARRSRSVGAGGERVVGADEFFLGVYTTAVEEGELLTKVSVPTRKPGTGDAMTGLTLGAHGTYVVVRRGDRRPRRCARRARLRRGDAGARDRDGGSASPAGTTRRRRARRGRGARRHDRSALRTCTRRPTTAARLAEISAVRAVLQAAERARS